MAPVVHGLDDKWGDQIEFIYLDIDDPQTDVFKRQLGYRYQPHIFLLDADGQVVEQFIGYQDGQTLQAAIRAVVG
jgi:thioredoxin-like negative regulator of GroEL